MRLAFPQKIAPRLLQGAVALFLGLCSAAYGAAFSVSPVRLDFQGITRSQLLAVTNSSDVPIRFLARSAGWSMDSAGAVQLTDDEQLVVFPASFTVAARATQNVRIGTTEPAGTVEKTWRVILEELPDPNAAGRSGASISVLSVVSVPVFMAPIQFDRKADLTWKKPTGQTLQATLDNQGNAHEVVASVALTAKRGEQVVQQAKVEGWYLLPSHQRHYTLKGDKAWCAVQASRFELMATAVDGRVIATRTVDAGAMCP